MRTIAIALSVLAAGACWSWNATGHMLTAAIGYERLPTETRAKVDAILKAHPDYAKWSSEYEKRGGGVGLGRYAFMQASAWPDVIRRSGSPYDHAAWHYVDYPLTAKIDLSPESPTPQDDVLFGLGQCESRLKSAATSQEEKAIYLAWMLHLVGDVHMPLHSTALVNDRYTAPEGDRGGNDFWIKDGGEASNLHSLWDNLPGRSRDPLQIVAMAKVLNPPGQVTDAGTPQSWSMESYAVARAITYQYLGLKGGDKKNAAIELPAGYKDRARRKAMERVTLAGVRISETLKNWLR